MILRVLEKPLMEMIGLKFHQVTLHVCTHVMILLFLMLTHTYFTYIFFYCNKPQHQHNVQI